jgi:hypothetical protein
VHHLTPSQKGAVAEAAFTAALIRLGLVVLRPLCEGSRYDLVVDLEPRLLRVQCKFGRRLGGVVAVNLQSSRCTPNGYVRTCYKAHEADAVGVYAPALDACYLVPIGDVANRGGVHLRIQPPRNNQAEGIKWARDYELASMIADLRASHDPTRAPARLDHS